MIMANLRGPVLVNQIVEHFICDPMFHSVQCPARLTRPATVHSVSVTVSRLVIENAKGKKCPADTINEFELYESP